MHIDISERTHTLNRTTRSLMGHTGLLSVAMLLGSGAATAQQAQPQDGSESDDAVHEVIVTAQFREQSIQDTALSITAISGEDLAAQRILQPKDLMRVTPGLYIGESSVNQTDPTVTLRGVGTNDLNSNQNPAVSLYIDGVSVPYNAMAAHAIFDLERVEVLKGPQGTLYGRNTTGGAVNFIPRRPGNEWGGGLRIGYGTHNLREMEGALDIPLAESFSVRIAGNSLVQEGWQTLDVSDYFPEGVPTFAQDGIVRRNGDQDRKAARISALWKPSDAFDMLTTVDGGWDRSQVVAFDHAGNLLRSDPTQFCSFAITGVRDESQCVSLALDSRSATLIPVTIGGYNLTIQDPNDRGDLVIVSDQNTGPRTSIKSFGGLGNRIDSESLGLNNTANWRVSRMTLTSVTGVRKFDRTTGIGQQGGPFRTIGGVTENHIDTFTQEIRLASDDSWEGLRWVAGGFYSKEKVADSLLPDLSEHHQFSAIFLSKFWQDTKAAAGFANIEYDLTEQWQAIGGVRYTKESRDFRYAGTMVGFGPVIVPSFNDKVSSDQVTWKAGLNYRPTKDLLVYGSISTGFRGQGFPASIAFSTNQLQPFEEETITAYELGFKSTLANGKLQLNAAAYYYDWKDMQAASAVDRNGVRLIVLTNAGDTKIKGAEVDVTWRPTDEFSFRLGANFMDAEIVSGELDGDTPSRSPDFMASGAVRYELATGANSLRPYIELGYSYSDDVFFQIPNHPGSTQEAFWLFNAQAGVKLPDNRTEVSFWVQNLANKLYRTEAFGPASVFLPAGILYGPPRSAGLTISYAF